MKNLVSLATAKAQRIVEEELAAANEELAAANVKHESAAANVKQKPGDDDLELTADENAEPDEG